MQTCILGDFMPLRLQLETGEVKEYSTWQIESHGGGYLLCEYRTLCGLHTSGKPELGSGCSHLGCAKSVLDGAASRMLVWLVMAFVGPFVVIGEIEGESFIVSSLIAASVFVLGISVSIDSYLDYRIYRELREFELNGTVNGIEAREI